MPLPFFLFLVAFSLAGSLFSRLAHLDPGPIAPVASLLTLGVGVWAVFAEYARAVAGAWPRLGAALALGAGAEVVGLATGFPFGRYAYTRAWWPTVELPVGPFPLALPFAWLLMAGAARLAIRSPRGLGTDAVLSRRHEGTESGTSPSCLRASARESFSVAQNLCWSIAGGLLAAAVDLVMEPVMAGPLGYWRWTARGPLPGGAPWANFLGWWGTATLAGLTLTIGAPPVGTKGPRWVLGGFVVLLVGLGLVIEHS